MAERTARRGPWRTRALLVVLMAAAFVVSVETASWVAGSIAFGDGFSRARLRDRRGALVESRGRAVGRPAWVRDEVLHPYVGFVPAPWITEGPLGFAGALLGPAPFGDDARVVIAVVGGSFAEQFAREGLPYVVAWLGELPEFRGKTFVSVNAAAAGYKEPQQLMTVAYMLALGERLDLVINLDGFNEMVLYPTENAPAGVFPAYPRRWHQRVEGVLSADALRAMLERMGLEDRRRNLALGFERFPWRHLSSASLLYLALDRRVERRLADVDGNLLQAEQRAGAPIVATGPRLEFRSEGDKLAFLVDLWRRSSETLHHVVTGHGARYYHFLQPNQYVPASKPMGPAERREAFDPTHPYRRLVEAAYPRLREAGRALRTAGVRFDDLTDAFATTSEPLYRDACCHVNERGNRIVADRILDAIRRDLEAARLRPCRPRDGSCR